MNANLFIGVYPAGLVYCDTSREEGGDYVRLAFLSYSKLVLEWDKPKCDAAMKREIEADAMKMMARRGYLFRTSTCGSNVLLGSDELMSVAKTEPLLCPKCGKNAFQDDQFRRQRMAMCPECTFHFKVHS